MKHWIIVACAGALLGCSTTAPTPDAAPSALLEYVGRYSAGPLNLLTVEEADGRLALSPPFWQSTPLLDPVAGRADAFAFALPEHNPSRAIAFERDAQGAITGLRTQGVDARVDALGLFTPLSSSAVLPIERILGGDVAAGAAAARAAGASDADLLSVAQRLLQRYPSKAPIAEALLADLSRAMPQAAPVHAMLADARVAQGRRGEARQAYEQAIALDPTNASALLALARLDAREPAAGAGYRTFFPYPIDALFAPPSAEEIAAVRADWAARDLAPREVTELATLSVTIAGTPFVAHVLRHRVHGDLHVGAVFVPRGARGRLPVIVDARGVDPDYTPLALDFGSTKMRQLGEARSRYIFVVPAFRGETLVLAGQSFTAEGDRANGWDGAADDAIALLSVALARTPEADTSRIVAFGQSRGGTVALLMGIRDPRIRLTIAQSAPADWFAAMDQGGWRTAEVLRTALANGTAPTTRQEGGQFYERFVQPVHEGRLDLAGARRRMLASSPLYFAVDLRRAIAMYGEEDRAVSVANARALDRATEDARVRVIVLPNRGHDLDFIRASSIGAEAVRALETTR